MTVYGVRITQGQIDACLAAMQGKFDNARICFVARGLDAKSGARKIGSPTACFSASARPGASAG